MSNRGDQNGCQPPLPAQPRPPSESQTETEKEQTSDQPKQICRNYVWGTCSKNAKCKFRHELDVEEMKKILKFCHDYQNRTGCTREDCTYLHTTREEENLFLTTGQIPRVLAERHAAMSASANVETIPQIAMFIRDSYATPTPMPTSASLVPAPLPPPVPPPPSSRPAPPAPPPIPAIPMMPVMPSIPIQRPPPPPPPPPTVPSATVTRTTAPVYTANTSSDKPHSSNLSSEISRISSLTKGNNTAANGFSSYVNGQKANSFPTVSMAGTVPYSSTNVAARTYSAVNVITSTTSGSQITAPSAPYTSYQISIPPPPPPPRTYYNQSHTASSCTQNISYNTINRARAPVTQPTPPRTSTSAAIPIHHGSQNCNQYVMGRYPPPNYYSPYQ
ncbi:unnamed protein product [Parnassius mnemosyne]|uniref:C3H1-type domain-containing protein n=1 Tax=Parnassius mnemosyne TaxID=213953 RepID=A0AAV1L2T8_9NEOP